jgi:ketosteroid isomerase-like protein/predicted ester cyclase
MDERLLAFMLRNDWEALSELLAAETYAESRRSGLQSLLTGREAVLDDIRTTITAPIVGDYACVATRGQRLSLSRQFYRGAIPESAFEVELLMVTELDDQGRIAGRVTFDTTCLDAAMTELDERFLAGEGSAHADLIEVPIRVARAINGRDWHALRSLFADDVSIVDYRPASLGVINGPDPWIESLKELVQLYPLRCDNLAYHALERDRLVAQWLVHGVTSDGAEVESAFHSMVHVRQGRIVRVEFFSVERLDAALDRLEDSRRLDSGVATANTCTLVVARAFRHMRDREWDALQALVAGRRRSVR